MVIVMICPYMRGKKYLDTLRNLLPDAIISGINIFLILLVLNLLSLNMGIFEQSFILAFTLYILIGILLLNLPLKKLYLIIRRKNKEHLYKILAGLILILFSFVLLLFTKMQILWVASIPILTSGLDLTLQGLDKKRKELHLLSAASFIYALFFMLLQTIPILWYTIQQSSLMFSNLIGSIINKPLSLAPSASGLWIVIIFLILSIVSFSISHNKKQSQIIRLVLNIVGLLIAWSVYLIILGFIEFESKNDVINLHYILFLFCLIPTFLYPSKYEYKESTTRILKFKDIKKLPKNGAIWALLFLFISSVMLTTFIGADTADTDDQKILFYGQNMLGTWDIPEYGKYGREASGMFGLLPIYLTASGYENEIIVENITTFLNITQPVHENITRYVNVTDYVSIIESPEINRDILKDIKVFVVANINKSFSQNEKDIIWEYVENGGSILVMGDHTNVGGIQEPLNDLLEPANVRFRFDSSLPLDSKFKWITCYQLFHHPITSKIDSLDEIQISVGASLDITSSSFPIIVGRYALSDEGDRLNEEMAYLGDYEYNPGEQLGDIVLVAGSYYGQGKVLVFGDTSTFQNSATPYSYPFIQGIFTWLNSERTETGELLQIGISILLLIAAFLVYIILKNTRISFAFFPVALCIALLISTVVNPMLVGDVKITGDVVYIDSSHGERFSLELFTDDSVNGFMLNLNRNGYLPIILRDFSKEKIAEGKILFFIAPTKSFTGDNVEFLKQYISNGGIVVLASGHEDKQASLPLLNEFELDVEGIPLGPVPYAEESPEEYENEPRFVDSWPIVFNEENSRSYYNFTWNIDYYLMVFVKQGNGGLLLISDSQYLLDKNIESIYDYWPGNIIFLKHILDDFKAMEE